MSPQDQLHLEAAEGWLWLENPGHAAGELDRISPALQGHPEVMQLRIQSHVMAERWDEAELIADPILEFIALWPFTSETLYALARIAVRKGSDSSAWDFLERAFSVASNPLFLRQKAMDEPDFEILWRSHAG